jgi:hypothetical protein
VKAISRRAIGAATTLSAAVALLAAPTAVSAAGSAASARSCSVSHFTVVWPVAGIYVRDGNYYYSIFYNKHLGDHMDGPTGGSDGNWTKIYGEGGGIAYMRDPALRFDNCG